MSAGWKLALAVSLALLVAVPVWAVKRVRASSVDPPPSTPRPGIPSEALAPARAARDRIETSERRMVEEDRALTQAIDRMAAGRFVPAEQKATVAAFRAYLQPLRAVATDLITHHREFVALQREYRDALNAAPFQFRDASRLFREYASGEPYSELRTEYEKLAADWLTLASLVETRAMTVERDERTRDFDDTLRYCERTALFLERLDAHLESFPLDFDAGAFRERHLADLKAYVDAFEQLRRHLAAYREKLRNGAVSPEVREQLTAAARDARATAVPVAYRPPSASPPPPAPAPEKPEVFRCFVGSTQDKGSVVALWSERDLAPGETYRVEVDGTDYANAVVVRTHLRKDNVILVQVDVTRPLPTKPASMTLVRLGGPPAAEVPTGFAARVSAKEPSELFALLNQFKDKASRQALTLAKSAAASEGIERLPRTDSGAEERRRASEASSIADAKALRAEAERFGRAVLEEDNLARRQAALLYALGRGAEAQARYRLLNAKWQSLDVYSRPRLVVGGPKSATVKFNLAQGHHYPFSRQTGSGGGIAQAVSPGSGGAFELVPTEGEFQTGDFLVVR